MRRGKFLSIVITVAVVGIVLGGCAAPTATPVPPAETAVPATPMPPTAAPPAPEESVVIIGTPADPTSMDPQMNIRWHAFEVYDNIFERLAYWDKDLNLIPQLATSWQQIDDLTWEFKLREGVNFTNGEPFNADTVKFTLERISDPEQGSRMLAFWRHMSEVDIVDDYTVRVRTEYPDPLMVERLAGWGACMIPCAYVEEVGDEEFAIKPVGTGPYMLESWVKDADLILVRNEDYWGERPPIDKVIFRPIPEASARVAGLLTGEIDLAVQAPSDLMGAIEESGVARVSMNETTILPLYLMCYDNCETPILKDTKFRLALSLAVDRESIVEELYMGVGKVPNGFIVTQDVGYDPSLPPLEYNPERARELIEESGYQGQTIVVYTTVNDYIPNDKALSETVTAMWEEVGINIDLRFFEVAERSEMLMEKSCPGIMIGNPSSSMLDPLGSFWRVMQPGGYYDHGYAATKPELLDLMTGGASEFDRERRAELFRRANQILLEDPPWVPIFQQGCVYGVGPRVDWEARIDYRIMVADEMRIVE